MTVDEQYKLSTYKEISVLAEDSPHNVRLVMDEATNGLYVKKVLPGTGHYDFYVRLASLEHKNLAKIHDVVCCGNCTYVFEEYTHGQTLQALLENGGVLPEGKAAGYIMQVCDALIYLHSQNPPIIHRDIKPENIMLSADGVIKLIDFDIAREFKQSAKRDTTFMGTKEYAAPEQYGFKQTDSRTDIYAIGVLLHEMLTGALPQNNITYKGALQKVIAKCLQLEPKQRYQSVSALKKALANTALNRHKRLGVCVLSGITAVAALVMFVPKISGGLYNPDSTPPSSSQIEAVQNPGGPDNPGDVLPSSPEAGTGQNTGDPDNPGGALSSSPQAGTGQNTGDVYGALGIASLETLMGQDYDDLYAAFEKIESFEESPAIILEQKAVDEIIRSITGEHYSSVAGTFQELSDVNAFNIIYSKFHFQVQVNNIDGNGDIHDFLFLIISKELEDTGYDVSITYYDADLETTFYFTTNDDKDFLPYYPFSWINLYKAARESPVVFSQPPVTDVTGTYYIGYKQKIEVFEEAGEMKFSYTDIRRSKDAEPLIVETIHKIDGNHYWIENYPKAYTERLIFNFSENRLTLFDDLRESDGEYGLSGMGLDAINLRGIYDKAEEHPDAGQIRYQLW